MEFLNYSNPRGVTTLGQACDRQFPGEEVACDHFFQICVSPRPQGHSSCMWSRIWRNQDTITFPPGSFLDQRKSRKNPLLFHFNEWKVVHYIISLFFIVYFILLAISLSIVYFNCLCDLERPQYPKYPTRKC